MSISFHHSHEANSFTLVLIIFSTFLIQMLALSISWTSLSSFVSLVCLMNQKSSLGKTLLSIMRFVILYIISIFGSLMWIIYTLQYYNQSSGLTKIIKKIKLNKNNKIQKYVKLIKLRYSVNFIRSKYLLVFESTDKNNFFCSHNNTRI